MTKQSLKLIFLRKYRTSKKYCRQLKHLTSGSKASIPLYGNGTTTAAAVNTNNGDNNRTRLAVGSNGIPPWEGRRRVRSAKNVPPVDQVDCCLLICDCISQYKLRTFLFLLLAAILSTTGLYYRNQQILQYKIFREDVFSVKHGIRLKRCNLPQLKPFALEVQPFVYHSVSPNCAHEQKGSNFDEILPVRITNGSYLVRDPVAAYEASCCYRQFHRNGEKNVWVSNNCQAILQDVTKIPDEMEYIELHCSNPATDMDYYDGFAPVHKKDDVEERVREFDLLAHSSSAADNRLSVLILGLDATSRMNFLRTMPKSNKYLLETLSAISFKGYTKVAENTLPNVIPFLTGKNLEEFKGECVETQYDGFTDSVHLDECPFIWKKFAENGYRTGFAEDDVSISIFNMNWANAFISPPTDYYLRPFSVHMQNKHSFHDGYCYGPRLSFEKLLEHMRSIAETFDDKSYFQFTWSTKLSHDDFNKLSWGDEPLLKWLQHLHTNDYLNKTALLIVGDHGSRLDKIRSTDQGKLEDRMPLAYMVLPPWFKGKYEKAYQNLQRNSESVITSAFDMHKTLYDFMNLDRLLDSPDIDATFASAKEDILVLPNNETIDLDKFRGSSLFRKLLENRTCFSAGIPLHWCVCHRKISQDKDSEIVKDATEFIVASMNSLLTEYSSCATFSLQSIDQASKWDPTEIIREGCEDLDDKQDGKFNNSSYDAGAGNKECNNEILVLQIAFTTKPGSATFETTVIQMEGGGWRLTEDVVRTNSYEGQSDCVEQKLKPYCFCQEESFW